MRLRTAPRQFGVRYGCMERAKCGCFFNLMWTHGRSRPVGSDRPCALTPGIQLFFSHCTERRLAAPWFLQGAAVNTGRTDPHPCCSPHGLATRSRRPLRSDRVALRHMSGMLPLLSNWFSGCRGGCGGGIFQPRSVRIGCRVIRCGWWVGIIK